METLSRAGRPGSLTALVADRLRSGVSVDRAIGDLLCGRGLRDVAGALERLDRVPTVLALVRLDAAVRDGRADAGDIHDGFSRLDDAHPADLHLWMAAIAAEFHLWQGELTGLLVADAALRHAPVHLGVVARQARGRLRRITAIVELLNQPEQEGLALFRPALDDFDHIAADEESALTVALATLALVMMRNVDVPADPRLELHRAIATLEHSGSERLGVALVVAAWVGAAVRDADEIDSALTRFHELDTSGGSRPVLDSMARFLAAVASTLRDEVDDRTAAALLDGLHGLREVLGAANGPTLLTASLLLDSGRWDDAEVILDVVDISLAGSLAVAHTIATRRIAVYRGAEGAEDALVDQLTRLDGDPNRRQVAYHHLRAARDLLRIGRASLAEELRARGAAVLAELGDIRPTRYEERLLERPASTAPIVDAVGGRSEIRLLGPDVVVRRRGEAVTLTPTMAHMLATLVVARGPVSTERYLEQVWPGCAPGTARNRMKALMHKLRRVLAIDADELIIRTAAGLELRPEGSWMVDLWELFDADLSDPVTALGWVLHTSPSVCDRQFPYDDEIGFARICAEQRWSRAARCALEHHVLSPTQLGERLLAVGLVDLGLIERVIEALDQRESGLVDALHALADC